ncbi:MAG TPA: hypothetical protein VM030_00640 [Acidimicrobiales bacterium]|nr:hypothetical protein [Acidimicrobiales bacterium]
MSTEGAEAAAGHLQCPFCHSYDVDRMFVASSNLDACDCASCGSRWDEDRSSGDYRGRSDRASIIVRRG